MGSIPSSLEPEALACGRTVGPGCAFWAAGGWVGGAFVAPVAGFWDAGVGLEGYFLAAAPAAARAGFEIEEPIVKCLWNVTCVIGSGRTIEGERIIYMTILILIVWGKVSENGVCAFLVVLDVVFVSPFSSRSSSFV